jgi:Protein of unknown function (DUF2569)
MCPLCGREANIQLPPPPDISQGGAAVAPAAMSATTPSARPIRKDLQGVGGWLLFFCVSITILTPAREFNVLRLQLEAAEFHPATLAIVAITVLGIVTGITLWTKSARAIAMVQVYFLVLGGLALFNLGVLLTAGGTDDDELLIVSHVRTLIYVAIWAAYFRRSERVRATFGRNL